MDSNRSHEHAGRHYEQLNPEFLRGQQMPYLTKLRFHVFGREHILAIHFFIHFYTLFLIVFPRFHTNRTLFCCFNYVTFTLDGAKLILYYEF